MKQLVKTPSTQILSKDNRNKPAHIMKYGVLALEQAEANVQIMTNAYIKSQALVAESQALVAELQAEVEQLKSQLADLTKEEANNETDQG